MAARGRAYLGLHYTRRAPHRALGRSAEAPPNAAAAADPTASAAARPAAAAPWSAAAASAAAAPSAAGAGDSAACSDPHLGRGWSLLARAIASSPEARERVRRALSCLEGADMGACLGGGAKAGGCGGARVDTSSRVVSAAVLLGFALGAALGMLAGRAAVGSRRS